MVAAIHMCLATRPVDQMVVLAPEKARSQAAMLANIDARFIYSASAVQLAAPM